LNALLQGSYFTPVDLAILAQQLDDEERMRMAESGLDSEEYRSFLEVIICQILACTKTRDYSCADIR
jgi:hypothetical protein